ncbi:MAG: type II toxin-antitoxin system VapC family toxin [Vicinamibacterales bacterium]
MILCDVNVLVYAFRKDAADHARHHQWLDALINGDAAYGMAPQVLSAVVRLTTHPKIFVQPSGVDEALAFADVLLNQPHCVHVQPGSRHWDIFSKLCVDAAATGHLVADAWYAALAIESGCEWVTTDRDYARFKGLRWRPPF